MAQRAVSDSFTGTGNGTSIPFRGKGNASLAGTFVATCLLERSFDAGVSWQTVAKNEDGDAASYAVPVSLQVAEAESEVLWRWRCSAYTSGTIVARIGQGADERLVL